MSTENWKWVRIITYTGSREWVEMTREKSSIKDDEPLGGPNCMVRSETVYYGEEGE